MATASAIPAEGEEGPSTSSSPFKSAASTPPGFPIPACSFDADVAGFSTRFVVASFGDCFLVAATQTGALGTVMRVSRCCDGAGIGGAEMGMLQLGEDGGDDALSFDDGGDRSRPRPLSLSSFDVATLSGRRDNPVLEASARSLAAALASRGVRTPTTLVCLALKNDSDAGAAREVVEKLKQAIEASTSSKAS